MYLGAKLLGMLLDVVVVSCEEDNTLLDEIIDPATSLIPT